MKINLIGPSYPFRGGISHYTTILFKNLKKSHQTNFYSFKRQYPKFLFPGRTDIDQSNIKLKDEDAQPILDSLNPFSWINVAIKTIKDKPDLTIFPWWVVFWVPQFITIIILLKIFSKTKIVFICHNVVEHESNFTKKILTKIILSRGDYFIVHSSDEKKRLINLIGERNIVETYHPTYSEFNFKEISKDTAKEKLNINSEKIILFFGFVRDYKGLKYVIKAMPKILEKINVKLLIAGEFWRDKSEYLDLINKLHLKKNVIIVDDYISNEEVPHYFYASDIVVLPYTSVTGSGLIQLAYGFNKPVVVSDIGALSQIVIDNKTGFLVKQKDENDIANTIIKFYDYTDKKEMEKNIKIENKRFSWDVLVNKIEEFKV